MKKKKQLDRSSVTSFDKLKMVDDFDESVSGQLETTATTKIVILQSNGCGKRFWRQKAEHFSSPLTKYKRWNKRPVDICLNFQRFSVHYDISWKCSDPSCSSQRVFTSSAVQTLALQLCNNRCLCWSDCRASVRDFVSDCSKLTLQHVAMATCLSTYLLCALSVLTMPAISVNRPLVLLLELRYKQLVTLERVYLITITFCIVFTASSTIRLYFYLLLASWCDIKVVSLCLVASFYSYTNIFFPADIIKIKCKAIFKSRPKKIN